MLGAPPGRSTSGRRAGLQRPKTQYYHILSAGKRAGMACSSATEQRVEFLNQHKERLVGTFVDVPGSAACAVLCHGLMAWRDSANYPVLAAALASEAGMSSLRFDFAGCGESDGAFAIAHNRREAEDIRSAVEWVRQSRGKRVQLLVGHSKGGANVLLYSAKYDDVPQVVNLAGRYDMARGIKERYGQDIMERVAAAPVKQTGRNAATGALFDYYLTKEELEDRLATDMRAAAAAIKTTRVLTVHGSDDQVIPVDDGRAFARDIAGSSLHIVSGADHNFRAPQHADDMIRAIVNFVTAASSPAN